MPLAAARAALDERLDRGARAPLAVAVSGGGDSLALLALTADWAWAYGRRLLVLHVDHRLNPASGAWTRQVEAAAERFGASFQPLAWDGPKPASGLPAAARRARHALLAQAARTAGAGVILLGHTLDDLREAEQMRRQGASVPSPRAWSPSPAWPEGRGVFLLRPLLETARADLRAFLRGLGEGWIEDPANADPRFARSRARLILAQTPAADPPAFDAAGEAGAAWTATAGVFSASRQAVREASPRDLAAACLCAAGASRPPRSERLKTLTQRLAGAAPITLSLAGARIEADAEQVMIAREAGEARRGGLTALSLAAGETAVWDGRFLIRAESPVQIRPLRGLSRRLESGQQAALRALPPCARGPLPAIVDAEGRVSSPLLGCSPVQAAALAPWRLAAFQRRLANESQALLAAAPILQMAKAGADDYVALNQTGGA